jgi:hypothetical protein
MKMLNTVKKSQDLYENRPRLTLLALVTLGTMVLAVCSLLLGCGSDSNTTGAVSKKSDKADVRANKGVQPILPLVTEKGTTPRGPGKVGNTNKFEQYGSGLPNTKEKMDERNAAAVKMADSLNPEILPGVTRRELDRKMEEAQKKAELLNVEILPGITKEEIERKLKRP